MREPWAGAWIWCAAPLPDRNAFVRFRRRFDYDGGPARLHITADSRYTLWVNGVYVGQGPVRAWPQHWRYDTYDLAPHLHAGENVVAILVNHYGEGTFQYLDAPPGLLAQLELARATIASDDTWRTSPDPALTTAAPRIGVQEAFEEQFDARAHDGWQSSAYDDAAWAAATMLRPAADGMHDDMQPRGIPFLTLEPMLPQRLVSIDAVQSIPHRFTIYAKPYLLPDDRSSNYSRIHGFLATQIWSPRATDVRFVAPHKAARAIQVNRRLINPRQDPFANTGEQTRLEAGWNSVLLQFGDQHLLEYVVCVEGPPDLRFCARGEQGGAADAAWAVVGPFALPEQDRARAAAYGKIPLDLFGMPLVESATEARGAAIWETGTVADLVDEPFFQAIRPEHLPQTDVFVQAYTDAVIAADVRIEGADGLLSNAEWTTLHPCAAGDLRLLLDFGREVIGFQRFEIVAPAGTIVDTHNFEFIQPDGRYNFAEGMNNSFRYICRAGHQQYQTLIRRGFQYSYLILRNMTGPVQIKGVDVLFNTYPQSRRGSFACADDKLQRIWEVGAHTLRLCAEDTYTDCPTYEQVHWVGDARNEALVDWVINGDARLWYRCLEQTGQSLDRSPLAESNVPSSWQNIIPAWTFLWMRSCREYLLFSGDIDRSPALLGFIKRNVAGIEQHINAQGLFDIHAWNMFDWAEMDTPADGVVTHQNCFAVHALRDAGELAQWLGEVALAERWRALADGMSQAINAHLWNAERNAYTDCLRDGAHSAIFSQQTQTVAVMSGVAGDHSAQRAELSRSQIHSPPDDFVKAGSPFFEFFLLEAYQQEGRSQAFIDTIRRDWGWMLDHGATTFWEMWSVAGGRLTRSHCHGWSAAPTFFLSTYVLGVQPTSIGFAATLIAPHLGDLRWCRGRVPTPYGDIEVQWENADGQPFALRVHAPEGIELRVQLPRAGTATINGRVVED
jgi:hypothetical protein